MKMAVSPPDKVFQAAERHARREQKSRSQLYAEAIFHRLAGGYDADLRIGLLGGGGAMMG
jgi:hypothetical protein